MTLEKMRSAVFAQKPVFKRVIQENGALSLLAYFDRLGADYRPQNVPKSRQHELVTLLVKTTEKKLGRPAAKAMAAYLKKRYVVSTAAHHDFATHPFFGDYLIAAGFANQNNSLSAVPVLSCAGISLNNSSFPRGLLVHDAELHEKRLRLVSLKNHHHPVYGYPGYAKAAISAVLHSVRSLDLPTEKKRYLEGIIADTFGGTSFKYKKLSEQITVGVHKLYKQVPGMAKNEIVYLPQEEITVALFLQHHLNTKTVIGRVVFDAKIRALFLKKFAGITGAFTADRKSGTHLFWGIKNNTRIALFVRQDKLVAADKSLTIPLTPRSIARALQAGTLMPSMSLTFMLLSFYYGLACAGGFSQVNYLRDMKSAYLALLAEVPGNEADAAIAVAVPTDLFAGEFVLATLGDKKTPATALDIILNNHSLKTDLAQLMKTATLKRSVDLMMPELYKIIAHA